MHLPSVVHQGCPPALWPGPAETRGRTAVVFFVDSSRFKCPEHPIHRTLMNFGRTAFVGARCPVVLGCCLRWDLHASSLSLIEQAGRLKGLLITSRAVPGSPEGLDIRKQGLESRALGNSNSFSSQRRSSNAGAQSLLAG